MRIIVYRLLEVIGLVLGLIVNVPVVLGLIMGVVELKPGWGPFSKPGPVVTLLYVSMVLGWFLAGFAILSWTKRRYAIGVGATVNPHEQWKHAFRVLMYVVTVPTTILWILLWIELLGLPKSGPGSDGVDAFLVVGSGLTLLGAGELVAYVALTVDWFLNPHHYTEPP